MRSPLSSIRNPNPAIRNQQSEIRRACPVCAGQALLIWLRLWWPKTVYGSASVIIRKRKVPVVWTPSRNWTLMAAPGASGVPVVTVPTARVELKPPPFGWVGGCSKVVPSTVTVHGVADGEHVPASVIPDTETFDEVIALRSACPPPGLGKVVTSTMRKRSRVTLPPVLFVTRRRIESVPKVELLPGLLVKSLTRFGETDEDFVLSRSDTRMVESRRMGEVLFSGPGAPSCCVTPEMKVPCVSANFKSAELSFVSFGLPGVVQPTPETKSHSLRKKEC